MKILVVTHETSMSGANKSLWSLIEYMHERYDIAVLVNQEQGALVDKLKEKGITTIFCQYGWWFAQTRTNYIKRIARYAKDFLHYYLHRNNYKKIISQLKEHEFDVVYTNTSTIDVGALIAEELKVPHIWHIREFGKEDFGFSNLCSKGYYEKIFKQCYKAITISNAVGNKYKSVLGKDKTTVIYNGLDMAPSSIDKSMVAPIRIGVVGQVCEAKGQVIAMKACQLLVDAGYEIQLDLAGNVDYSYLNKNYPKWKECEWLNVLGQIEDVAAFRDNEYIELVCSKCEAFGRVTLEAMLCGVPVVGSASGGTSELIEDRQTGLLFQPGNEKDLFLKLKDLIQDEKLYLQIQGAAKEWAKSFTMERTARLVMEVFDELGVD